MKKVGVVLLALVLLAVVIGVVALIVVLAKIAIDGRGEYELSEQLLALIALLLVVHGGVSCKSG